MDGGRDAKGATMVRGREGSRRDVEGTLKHGEGRSHKRAWKGRVQRVRDEKMAIREHRGLDGQSGGSLDGKPNSGNHGVQPSVIATQAEAEREAEGQAETASSQELSERDFEHVVAYELPVPLPLAWGLWVDLAAAPQWMKWIDRVEVMEEQAVPSPALEAESERRELGEEDKVRGLLSSSHTLTHTTPWESHPLPPTLTRWVCCTTGFEVAWVARVCSVSCNSTHSMLTWRTVEGIQCYGEVVFTPSPKDAESCLVHLCIRHSLPPTLARIMSRTALSALIQATLRSDLERFEQYSLEMQSKRKESTGS